MPQPERARAPHSSTLAWKIPWTEEPGRLQSMGSHSVGHDWSDLAAEWLSTYYIYYILTWELQRMVKNAFSVFLLFQHRHLHSFIQSVCVYVYINAHRYHFFQTSTFWSTLDFTMYHFFPLTAKAVIQSPAHICVPSPSFSYSLKMQYL